MAQDYIEKMTEIIQDLVKHGYGEVHVEVSEIKNTFKSKIIIKAGRSWVFFTEKVQKLDSKNII